MLNWFKRRRRPAQERNGRRAGVRSYRTSFDRLEERTVPTVIVQDQPAFHIRIDQNDNVSVDCDPVFQEVRVFDDGVPTTYETNCDDVTSLTLKAAGTGTFANTLDVSAVTRNAFDILPLVRVSAGGGDDLVIGSPIDDRIEGGTGADTLVGGGGNDAITGGGFTSVLIALTDDNRLLRFDIAQPGAIANNKPILGLQEGENIIGIDVRPETGVIYALSDQNRLYQIPNAVTGQANLVGTLSTSLSGSDFGVDFNPVADRLRIVSDADQNLRVNPDTGETIVDGTLSYSAEDINAGENPQVTAAAYTNNIRNISATVLYGIDAGLNVLVRQNPNVGSLTTVGSLQVDVSGLSGFDIEAGTNQALAALNVGGVSRLYRVDLASGRATLVGDIGGSSTVRGLVFEADAGRDSLVGGEGNDDLTAGASNDTLDGGNGSDRVVSNADSSYLLTNNVLQKSAGGAFTLVSIERANLTGGSTNNQFTVGSFTGLGALNGGGGNDRVIVSENASFSLSDTLLKKSSGGVFPLSSIEFASLAGGGSNNTFYVSGFTGAAIVNGGGGSDVVIVQEDASYSLTDSLLKKSSRGVFTLTSIENARLSGGDSNNSIDASSFSGFVLLEGQGGNDVLRAGAGDDILDGGPGFDTGVGGAGFDTFISVENQTQ